MEFYKFMVDTCWRVLEPSQLGRVTSLLEPGGLDSFTLLLGATHPAV